VNKNVLSQDLKTDRESLIKTVCGSEFQTDGAENRKACLEKSVLANGNQTACICNMTVAWTGVESLTYEM